MPEEATDLGARLIQFSLRIVKLCASLPDSPEAKMIRGQLLRSGTSPGAHHREARRARSTAEFVSKMNGGLQELDETDYWLELLIAGDIVSAPRLGNLREETNQLIAIFVTSINTARDHAS